MSVKLMMIGGSGRSGTTVLCRTFGLHPHVSDVPEWRFATDPDGILDFYEQCQNGIQTPFHFTVRLTRLERLLRDVAKSGILGASLGSSRARGTAAQLIRRNISPRYGRINAQQYSPNFDSLIDQLVDRLCESRNMGYWVGMHPLDKAELALQKGDSSDVRSACGRFLQEVAGDVCAHQGVKYHLEKNTWSILSWHKTLELLPDAQLIHIVRDPRDVVASYSQQTWCPDSPVESARVLSSVMNEWERVKQVVPPESFRLVRLEDLTAKPEETLRDLCNFWSIDWADEMLQTRFSSESFGRWKRDLTLAEQRAIRPYIDPILETFDYE